VEVIDERVVGIDVGKQEIVIAVRAPAESGGGRHQQVRTFKTFSQVLQPMVGWLLELGVTPVAMEATGVYCKPVFRALCEVEQIEVLLVNARHVQNVPGRKPDIQDCAWLAQWLECGLLRGRFLPPKDIAAIRELTRARKKLIETRTRELQRLSTVLKDGGIKIDSVACSSTPRSARAMIEARIAAERDPRVLAELARGVMRTKIPDLTLACAGRFGDHHALLARMHTDHIDHLTSMIEDLDARIDEVITPFAPQRTLLRSIPGIGARAAPVIISEIGVDMSRFPTAAHLASWAGLCPGNHESAGQHKSGRTRKGNVEVRTILTECAWAAGRTGTYIGARFRRRHRRFGKQGGGKAAIAIAHTLIVIIWHVLHNNAEYRDLGSDYFTRYDNPEAHKRRLIRDLHNLGYDVTVHPAA
jgi:transposase